MRVRLSVRPRPLALWLGYSWVRVCVRDSLVVRVSQGYGHGQSYRCKLRLGLG